MVNAQSWIIRPPSVTHFLVDAKIKRCKMIKAIIANFSISRGQIEEIISTF